MNTINPSPSCPHPHALSHTRFDYAAPSSPRIPIPANLPLTTCTPEIEKRIRRLLTWHSGDCGLIDSRVLQMITDMHFEGEVSMQDLFKLAKPLVYSAIYWRVEDIREARSKQPLANRVLGKQGR